MENQKIINLFDKIDTDSKHFATKKWCIINDENNTNYSVNKDTGADNPDTIKHDTRVLNQICVIMQKCIFWLMVLLEQLMLLMLLD